MTLSENISRNFLHVLPESGDAVLTGLLATIRVVRHPRDILRGVHLFSLILGLDLAVLVAVDVDDVDVESDVLKLKKFLLGLLV